MADPEQEAQMREALSTNLDSLLGIAPESLVQAKRLGSDLSFKEGLHYFERILHLFQPLRDCSLEEVPLPRLNKLLQSVNQAISLFQQIKEFNAQGVANRNSCETQSLAFSPEARLL